MYLAHHPTSFAYLIFRNGNSSVSQEVQLDQFCFSFDVVLRESALLLHPAHKAFARHRVSHPLYVRQGERKCLYDWHPGGN